MLSTRLVLISARMDFDYAQFSAAFPWFFPVAAFLVGACIGSFLNVVIYRVPKEESIAPLAFSRATAKVLTTAAEVFSFAPTTTI